MTLFGFAFGAHEGDALLLGKGAVQPIDAIQVVWLLAALLVIGVFAAEAVAQVEVANAGILEMLPQGSLGEIGLMARLRARADVNEKGDLLGAQGCQELGHFARAVADGVDGYRIHELLFRR